MAPVFLRAQTEAPKEFSKLYVVPEINLSGISWQDLGLEKSSSFSDPIADSWVKWINNALPQNLSEVSPCTGDCYFDFLNWIQLKQGEGMQVPSQYQNALWLKISFTVRRLSFKPDLNEWKMEWDGSAVLLDSNTKQTLYSQTLYPEERTWQGLDQKNLNSVLASGMYKTALDAVMKSSKKIETSKLSRLDRLVIQGHRNLDDILSLMNLLRKEGESIALSLKIDQFGNQEAQILCFYRGEEKSFTDLLSRLKELKSTQSYRLVNESTGVHPVLKLIAP
jgi:hypothetical protein